MRVTTGCRDVHASADSRHLRGRSTKGRFRRQRSECIPLAGGDDADAGKVRVQAGCQRQKRESAWMGADKVRVTRLFVRQKPESVWICAGALTIGGGQSIHYRQFGTHGNPAPAPGRPPSIHYRQFGTRGGLPPAPEGIPALHGIAPTTRRPDMTRVTLRDASERVAPRTPTTRGRPTYPGHMHR